MATTAVYAKLGKPELQGGKLVVQTGTFDFGASATLSAVLTTPIKTVVYAGFQSKAGAPASGSINMLPRITTAALTSALVVNRTSASARYFQYVLLGY